MTDLPRLDLNKSNGMSDNKEPEIGKTWLKHHIDILKQWKAKIFIYLWLHDYSVYYYAALNNWLSYPIIVISTFCSATVLTTDDFRIHVAMGILTMVNAIISGFNRQLNPGSMMQQHALMSRRYGNLIRNIDTCLSLTERMRPHPSVFIERIGVEIDNLVDNNIDYPNSIVSKFEKEFGQIDRLLYGENIVELVKIGRKTGYIVNDVRRRSILGTGMDDTEMTTSSGSDDIEAGTVQPHIIQEANSISPKLLLPFKILTGMNGMTSFASTFKPQLNTTIKFQAARTSTGLSHTDLADPPLINPNANVVQEYLVSKYGREDSPNSAQLFKLQTNERPISGLTTQRRSTDGVRRSLDMLSGSKINKKLPDIMSSLKEEASSESPFKRMQTARLMRSSSDTVHLI